MYVMWQTNAALDPVLIPWADSLEPPSMRATFENSCPIFERRPGLASGVKPCGAKERYPVKRFEKPLVQGWLHEPPKNPARIMVLTHGAGSNCEAPLLVAVA